MTKFEPGDLVLITIIESGFTLCAMSRGESRGLREYSHYRKYPATLRSLGGTMVLVTKVTHNKLDQPLRYEILQGDTMYSCTALLADKYFIKLS